MRTVLGFDSWVAGSPKYARLVKDLRELGFNLVLIHIGSWGGDPGRPAQEKVGELEVRDITYYKGLNFEQVIAVEKPAAVVFLSNDVFAHRAFNRYALHQGVPTLHLYHGLAGVQAVRTGRPYKVNRLAQARFVLERIPKALRNVWPCYARALARTGATWADWRRFGSDILNLAQGNYIARAAPDAMTTRCAVYTQADVAHAVNKYGHAPDHVHVVGNPDIQMFGLHEDQIGTAATADTVRRTEVIYVDTGLIYAGMVFDSPDDFHQHLIATRDALAAQGRQLAIKLHPQHFRTDFPDRLRQAGIAVLANDSFVPRLQACAAAIVEPSTAALIPGLVGVPLLLARHGKLSGLLYGDVLVQHPRARYLDDPRQLNAILAEEAAGFSADATRAWITTNAGPLPSHQMPARVARLLRDMADNARPS